MHTLYRGPRRAGLESEWACAHSPIPLSLALNLLVSASALVGASAALLIGATLGAWTEAFLVACILWALGLLLGFYLPRLAASRFAAALESDLPLALRSLALYLSIPMPIERALAQLADEGYASSALWQSISRSIQAGESVPAALAQASLSVRSPAFSRAASALIAYYQEGASPEPLLSLADELGSQQSAAMREQSAKAGVGGLLFVATSCILPAFALVLFVSAGPLLGLPGDPMIIWLLLLLVLPALDALVLGFLLLSAPTLSGSWRPEAMAAATRQQLARRGLSALGWNQALLASIALALLALAFGLLFPLGGLSLRIGLLLALIPLSLLALAEGEVHAQVARLESELPALLLGAASTRRFSIERLLEQAAHLPPGPLREQSEESLRQIRAGANPLHVLSAWAARTPSVLLARTLTLLSVGWRAGGSMAQPLRALSTDAISTGSQVRERAGLLATQRYTLWAAALLLPAILAVSLSFGAQAAAAGALDLGGPAPSLLGTGAATGASAASSGGPASPALLLVQAATQAAPLYLVLHALLTALYLALSAGARERFVPYAAALVLVSQLVWLALAPAL